MLIRCYFECCLHCAYTTVLCDESSRLIYWNVNFGHEYSRDGNWFFIMTHFPAYCNAFASYKSWCFAPHWRGPRKFSQILRVSKRSWMWIKSLLRYMHFRVSIIQLTFIRPRGGQRDLSNLLFRTTVVECPLRGDLFISGNLYLCDRATVAQTVVLFWINYD